MKLADIFEGAGAGMVSVSSIGQIEYAAHGDRINLIRRNAQMKPCCVARIQRYKNQGWKFVTTKHWKQQNLPHFGNLTGIKAPAAGKKTLSGKLSNVLGQWGIKYDSLDQYIKQK